MPRLVVDLIPYNPVPGDVFERPGRAAVSAFQQELKRRDPTLFVGVRQCARRRRDGRLRTAPPSNRSAATTPGAKS